jgi:ribosomal protein S18 acetylase RimI-like enzyme
MLSSESLSLRAATAQDESFLLDLFTSTRIDEFKFLDGPPGQLEALMRMQFDLQRQQYAAGYPEAEHQIILRDGKPIGRLFVDETDREIALVDVALLPAHRNSGIGTQLLDQLLDRATAAKKAVRLHVVKSNPALHLYERLGFSKVGEDGMYFEMLCRR